MPLFSELLTRRRLLDTLDRAFAAFAEDAAGHAHKGKGKGGGQFAKKGAGKSEPSLFDRMEAPGKKPEKPQEKSSTPVDKTSTGVDNTPVDTKPQAQEKPMDGKEVLKAQAIAQKAREKRQFDFLRKAKQENPGITDARLAELLASDEEVNKDSKRPLEMRKQEAIRFLIPQFNREEKRKRIAAQEEGAE